MEGLIAMLIVGWILSAISKKGKKKATPNKNAASSQSNAEAVIHRAEYAAKLRAELEKRKRELSAQPQNVSVMAEGESYSHAAAETGSLSYDSSEGECICDPDLDHVREVETDTGTVYEGQIGNEPAIDFSAKGIMQGVVMSEILTRPTQRYRKTR